MGIADDPVRRHTPTRAAGVRPRRGVRARTSITRP